MKYICMTGWLVLSALLQSAFSADDVSGDLAEFVASSGVPSLAAAAVLDGKLVAVGASGVRKRGHDERVTIHDKYHIGSCTKSMTAVLGAVLVDEGKLRWETTVSDVFSDMKIHPGYREVTLKQLLSNMGGCPAEMDPGLWAELWEAEGSTPEQRRLLVKGILSQAPDDEPGEKSRYSNAGFAIAGAMMEQTLGVSYEELLQEKLFRPLKMNSAGFRAPATMGKVDQPYGHDPDPVDPEPRGDNPPAIAPAGAVHCSVIDFAKYAAFHLGAYGQDILPAAALSYLHDTENGLDEYAMGWIITKRAWAKGKVLTHAGSNTSFYAVIWIAPELGFAAVAMCNTGEEIGYAQCDRAIGLMVEKYVSNITLKN